MKRRYPARPTSDVSAEEHATMLTAIDKLSPKARRTLWVVAEHPRLIAAVDMFLDELAEGLK